MDWGLRAQRNPPPMKAFRSQVRAAPPGEFILMILDGARSPQSKEWVVPENRPLIRLPADSPERNPPEQVWDEVREKAFPKRVSAGLEPVGAGVQQELGAGSANPERVRSLTAWPWIVSLHWTVK